MVFIGFMSQHMLLRHANGQIEVQLPHNWRIVALHLFICDTSIISTLLMFYEGLMANNKIIMILMVTFSHIGYLPLSMSVETEEAWWWPGTVIGLVVAWDCDWPGGGLGL